MVIESGEYSSNTAQKLIASWPGDTDVRGEKSDLNVLSTGHFIDRYPARIRTA
jgi:hypothetical protein